MKKLFIFSIFAFLSAGLTFGQSDSKEVEKIKELHKEVTAEVKKIQSDSDAAYQSELAVNELVINKLNKSWPAVGTYKVVYRFYYKSFGEEPYPDTLVYVTKETRSAARKYSEEFLFNDNGLLVFSSWKAGNDSDKALFYFKNLKLISKSGSSREDSSDSPTSEQVAVSAKSIVRLFTLSIS